MDRFTSTSVLPQRRQTQARYILPRVSVKIATLTHKSAPSTVEVTKEGQLVMHFFRSVGSRQVGGAFDRQFWAVDLLQATLCHPIIWHSCSAMAAIYWKVNADTFSLDQSTTIKQLEIFGLTQYHHTLSCVAQLIKRGNLSIDEKQVLLMTNLVLTAIGILLGKPEESMVHLRAGIKLFHEWHVAEQLVHSNLADSILSFKSLSGLFQRFYTQSYTLRDKTWPNILTTEKLETMSAEPFDSLTDAYFSLERILNNHVLVWRKETRAAATGEQNPIRDEGYISRMALNIWQHKFDTGLEVGTLRDREGILILQLRAKITAVVADMNVALSELAYDEFNTEYQSILDMAEEVADIHSKQKTVSKSFSFSACVAEPLAMIAYKCRDIKLRQRAMSLLQRFDMTEGVMNTSYTALLVKRLVDLEEEQLAKPKDPNDEDCHCIQGMFLCNDHRILDCASVFKDDGQVSSVVTTVRDVRLGRFGKELYEKGRN